MKQNNIMKEELIKKSAENEDMMNKIANSIKASWFEPVIEEEDDFFFEPIQAEYQINDSLDLKPKYYDPYIDLFLLFLQNIVSYC